MAFKLLVNGVDKTTSADQAPASARVALRLNNRGEASFPAVPGYVPSRYDQVIAYRQDGVTKLFGGLLTRRDLKGIGAAASSLCRAVLNCSDGMTYLDWTYVTLDYTGGSTVTLKTVLTDIAAAAAAAGHPITLDPAQATGPSLASFAVVNKRASDLIRDMSTASGYVGRVDADFQLKMFVPGTDAAPYSITDAAPHCTSFEWSDPDEAAANRVVMVCGPSSGAYAFVDEISFTADGVAASWVFDVGADPTFTNQPYTEAGAGTIHVGGVVKNTALGEFTWTCDSANATATLTLTAGAPAAGTVIDFKRNIQPPFTVVRSSGASPVISDYDTAPDVLSVAGAVAAAAGRLAQLNQSPRKAVVTSLDHGWLPGQLVAVDLASRNATATNFVITDVEARLVTGTYWEYRLTMTESTTYQGGPIDRWRTLFGSDSSGTVVTVVSGPSSSPGAWSVYLGGSTEVAYRNTSAAKVPNAVRLVIPVTGSYRLRAAGRARNGGVSCQFYLRDLTAASHVITPAVITSTTELIVADTQTLTAGHEVQLWMTTSVAGEDVYALWATLELIA